MSWQKRSTWQQYTSSAVNCKMSNDQQAWVQYAVLLQAMVTRWERKQHLPYVARWSAVSSAPDLGSSHVGFVDQFRCHTRQFRCGWNCPRFCVAQLLGAKSIKWTPDGCVHACNLWNLLSGFQLHLGLRVYAENSVLLSVSLIWHLCEDGMLWSAVRTKVMT